MRQVLALRKSLMITRFDPIVNATRGEDETRNADTLTIKMNSRLAVIMFDD